MQESQHSRSMYHKEVINSIFWQHLLYRQFMFNFASSHIHFKSQWTHTYNMCELCIKQMIKAKDSHICSNVLLTSIGSRFTVIKQCQHSALLTADVIWNVLPLHACNVMRTQICHPPHASWAQDNWLLASLPALKKQLQSVMNARVICSSRLRISHLSINTNRAAVMSGNTWHEMKGHKQQVTDSHHTSLILARCWWMCNHQSQFTLLIKCVVQ